MSVVDVQNKQVDLPFTGGLLVDIPTADVPPGLSPNNQDCDFFPRAVQTRSGIGKGIFPAIGGNPTINYLKTFEQQNLAAVLLALDGNGTLWQAASLAGGLTQISGASGSGTAIVAGARGKSTTLFGHEYVALSDGKFGLDIPRQFDGTNFDRVTQAGPGAPPLAVADNTIAITAISRTGGTTSVTTAVNHGFVLGQLIQIAGETFDATFNGFTVVLTIPAANQFTAFGSPGVFVLNSLARAGGTVTAIVSGNAPNLAPGATIAIVNPVDASFAGLFILGTISGNTLTWAQAGANVATTGGQLYANAGSTVDSIYQIFPSSTINGGPQGSVYGVIVLNAGQNFSNFVTGNQVTVAGAAVAAWNGTYTIQYAASVGTNQWGLQIVQPAGPPAISNGGTATAGLPNSSPTVAGVVGPGSGISAGVHQVVVAFQTRQNAILKPSPPIAWISAGGFQLLITGIPTGPPNITARILGFTAAGGGTFSYLPSTVINDNATRTLTANFSDAQLAGGTPMALLFNQVELGECAGFVSYGSRLIAWGERRSEAGFQNLSFEGGFNGATPLGWITDQNNGAGGAKEAGNVWYGFAYRITGDGLSNLKGMITQSAYQNYLGTQIIQPGKAYSARVRLAKGGGIANGNAVIELFSPSLGSLGTFVTVVNAIGATYSEFIGPLMAAQAAIPTDLILRYYLSGTPTNGGYVIADNIEIYPTNQPYNATFARASNVNSPEAFDGVNGLLQPPTAEPIRCMFVLSDRSPLLANDHLYAAADNGIYRTQDNGQNPSTWTWSVVSKTIGTPSLNGVDVAEDSVAIAHPSGLYWYFFGGEPTKISQEIQALAPGSPCPFAWNQINWVNGFTVWVKVDLENKRLLIGAPMGAAALPTNILMMNYSGLVSSSQIISTPPMHPSYTGRFIAQAIGRKWSPWSIAANCCWIEPKDSPLLIGAGTGPIFFGNATANGKIYNLTPTNGFLDDGNNIPSFYDTAFVPSDEQKEQFGMLGSLCLLSYLRGHIQGSGNIQFTFFGPDYVNSQSIPLAANPGVPNQIPKSPAAPAIVLSSPAKNDIETFANFVGERINVRVQAAGPAGTGPWFSGQKLELFLQPNPAGAIRGFN